MENTNGNFHSSHKPGELSQLLSKDADVSVNVKLWEIIKKSDYKLFFRNPKILCLRVTLISKLSIVGRIVYNHFKK